MSEEPYTSFNLAPHVGEAPESTARNWSLLAQATGIGREALATCRQVHGHRVLSVDEGGHHATEADALLSVSPGVGVGVFTADCVPVLYAVPGRGVAAAHCGWRGTAAGLAGATLRVLAKAVGLPAAEVHVWLGASIARGSYEVGAELRDRFGEAHLRPRTDGKYELDVAGAVAADLIAAGATPALISGSPVDTFTDERYYSYRRDGVRTGRMLSYVRLE